MATRIPYHRLQNNNRGMATGIGGTWEYYSEPAVLGFEDEQSPFLQCELDIFIAETSGPVASRSVPSLLGRDFLNLCDVRLNHSASIVALDPLNIDGSGMIGHP